MFGVGQPCQRKNEKAQNQVRHGRSWAQSGQSSGTVYRRGPVQTDPAGGQGHPSGGDQVKLVIAVELELDVPHLGRAAEQSDLSVPHDDCAHTVASGYRVHQVL
jgi:hypothetical protein